MATLINGLTVCCEQVFSCCKEGFKLIMDVILCDFKCCPGLVEQTTDDAPHLGHMVTCQAQQVGCLRSVICEIATFVSTRRVM